MRVDSSELFNEFQRNLEQGILNAANTPYLSEISFITRSTSSWTYRIFKFDLSQDATRDSIHISAFIVLYHRKNMHIILLNSLITYLKLEGTWTS